MALLGLSRLTACQAIRIRTPTGNWMKRFGAPAALCHPGQRTMSLRQWELGRFRAAMRRNQPLWICERKRPRLVKTPGLRHHRSRLRARPPPERDDKTHAALLARIAP